MNKQANKVPKGLMFTQLVPATEHEKGNKLLNLAFNFRTLKDSVEPMPMT